MAIPHVRPKYLRKRVYPLAIWAEWSMFARTIALGQDNSTSAFNVLARPIRASGD